MGLKNAGLRAGELRNVSEVDAIPDSVEIQYTGPTYSNGDSTWVDDATGDGSQDMSLTGDAAESTLSDGSDAVEFDGGDDYGLVDLPSGLEGSSLTSFSLEFALQTSSSNSNALFGVINNSADQQLQIWLNADGNFSTSTGDLFVRLEDENDNRLQFGVGASLTDGNRHDISIIFDDTTTNSVSVVIDGASKTVNKTTTGGPGSGFSSWDRDAGIAAVHDDSGSISSYLSVAIAALRGHKSSISQQTIDTLP